MKKIIGRRKSAESGYSYYVIQCDICGTETLTMRKKDIERKCRNCNLTRINGYTIAEISELTGVPARQISRRIQKCFTEEQIFSKESLVGERHVIKYKTKDNKTAVQISSETGYSPSSIRKRFRKKLSDECVSSKIAIPNPQRKIIEFNGESHCISEWARILRINKYTLMYRLKKYPPEIAFRKALNT